MILSGLSLWEKGSPLHKSTQQVRTQGPIRHADCRQRKLADFLCTGGIIQDPSFDQSKYDSIVWNPITYYPVPKPSTQVGQKVLDKILNYTNTEMKEAIAQRKPLVTTAGPRSLIFRGAITGVDTSKEGLQFYEVVPVALVVAGTQMATGHRTMDTRLYFEGELIDAATNKPVIKVVRQGEGKDLNNESTPMAFENIKQVIDDMATDATMFDVNKK
ncbi:hypothetical protein AUS40_25280 [Escherichia coli]|nr:hypothetical protein AUS31_26365 [Escherichia coli]KXM95020.1 hypothetical protein AUS41_27405 [Escherichia coli]KXN17315.1 hypothetical protein AUS40_25280 [Escherichia coli]GCJ31023.1 lipoprotein [Escherichia coli]